ncbi:MAG: hypothetical protein GXO76_00920 [Calditrichaeota bacterium]|nr:hypothetical protein [Calditrichota bacterium]
MPQEKPFTQANLSDPIGVTTDLLLSKNSEQRVQGIHQLRRPFYALAIQELHRLSRHSNLTFKIAAKGELDTLDVQFRKRIYKIRQKMRREPDYPGYQLALAVVFLRYSQIWPHVPENRTYFLTQASKLLNQLIRLVQPKTRYFYYRGWVRKEMGDFRGAISDFRKILHLHPTHWGAVLGLLESLFELGDFQKISLVIESWPGTFNHPYQRDIAGMWRKTKQNGLGTFL